MQGLRQFSGSVSPQLDLGEGIEQRPHRIQRTEGEPPTGMQGFGDQQPLGLLACSEITRYLEGATVFPNNRRVHHSIGAAVSAQPFPW